MNNDNSPSPEVSTESQRRELDIMSAQLLDKLNTMIAEQEVRVQEFARQYPNAPIPSASDISTTPEPRAPRQPRETEFRQPTPQPMRSVTPPRPAAMKRPNPEPQPILPKSAPPLPATPVAPTKGKEENGIGCGPLIVIISIIIILMRCCS